MTSQFGGAKNPPWARPASVPPEYLPAGTGAASVTQASLAQAQNALLSAGSVATTPVYNLAAPGGSLSVSQPQYNAQIAAIQAQQQLQQAAASAAAVLPQPGIAIPTTLATSQVATVSYPPPRVAQPQGSKQRVFTGTVTKLHDNFGFVDEDVFFQTSCVKGSVPKVGARVLVEATYNANMPFKWNATRIQVLANQGGQSVATGLKGAPQLSIGAGLNPPGVSIPQPVPPVGNLNHMAGNQIITQSIAGPVLSQQPPPLMAQNPQPSLGLIPNQRSGSGPPHRSEPGRFQGIKRDKERERERDRERRERKENRLKRQRSPPHPVKPPAPRPRSPIRRRPARVIPRYVVQIPKLSFDTKGGNVIALKSRYSNMYIPSDFFHASFSWADVFPIGRPFRLGSHCQFHIMQKDVEPIQQIDAVYEAPDADHSFSAKVMLLASPPLEELYQKSCGLAETDSETFQHPTRLLQFLVGVRGKNEPMAIGGAWSPSLDGANPADDPQVLIKTAIRTTKALTGIDLSGCTQWYRYAEIAYLRPETNHKGRQVPARVETVVLFLPDVWTCSPTRLEWGSLQVAYSKQLQRKIAAIEGTDPQGDEETEEEKEPVEKLEPTNHALLDPKTMKIIDLRHELECRNLSSKGLKSQLIARLTKSLKQEKEDEDEEKSQPVTVPVKVPDELEPEDKETKKKEEEDKKAKEKREKAAVERKYCLPSQPTIIVHPSPTAKGGKFDCSLMSLSVLLDYRQEDNKEHSFEVSLFAELFNEMLMRDYGFQIYKTLVAAPPKKEEDKKDDKKDDKKEEKKDDKKDSKEPTVKKKKTEDSMEEKTGDSEKSARKDSIEEEMETEEGLNDEETDEKSDGDLKKEKDKKDKDKKKDKKKYVTTDPALLMAFVYFDQNHTGYLLDKDMEEIIHTMGLHLSRAQVKKLVQKVVTRDTLNYRKLTDKAVQGDSEAKADDTTQESLISDEELCRGNLDHLMKTSISSHKSPEKSGPRNSNTGNKTESPQSHIIHYKGSLLDIDSLMMRLEKSEKSRGELEKKMEEMTTDMFSMKSNLNTTEYNCQKLTSELRQVKTELEKEHSLREEAETCNKKWTAVVKDSRETISTALATMSAMLEGGPVTPHKVETEKEQLDKKPVKKERLQ